MKKKVGLRPSVASMALVSIAVLPVSVWAQAQDQASDLVAPEVEVIGTYDTGIGTSDAASEGRVTQRRIETRPALRPGELLEYVPGVIITQHSGDGKANQYFLRGFNLDHGTDISIYVAGMPVNMPTHAHGQGYADLNFLIPELVSGINFRKGPYYADVGDFSAAGQASIDYVNSLPYTLASVTLGENNYQRAVLAGSPAFAGGTLLYGLELMGNDGPWDNPENFAKINGVLRYSRGDQKDGFSITGMAYKADWDSTDQVPLRAVESGQLDRFGAIDPTDGGETSRYSLSYEQHQDFQGGRWMVDVYGIHSKLNLFSNFTYFLDHPFPEGDQFEQAEDRTVFGMHPRVEFYNKIGGMDNLIRVGLQLRRDELDPVGLYHNVARDRLETTREDKVKETSIGVYIDDSIQVTDWFRAVPGIRADYYDFDVNSSIPENSGKANDSIVSPKLNLIFGPWAKTEYFFNIGNGFHSNDARGTTITVDPSTGDPAEKVDPLVRSKGMELGVRTEIIPNVETSLSVWQLKLDSELLFVGDAGTTEPSRPSKREGIEWSTHYRPLSWLLIDFDLSASKARFTDYDPAGDYIPGSIDKVASFGLTVDSLGPWYGMLQYRYFGPRPLIEDNSVRSESTQITNLRVGYKVNKVWRAHLDVYNLFDRKDDDITYYYESQLANETSPVEDKHFHPVEPRSLRFTVTAYF